MKKYGTGHIIPEEGDDKKTAKKHWTDKDAEELKEENDDDESE